MKTCIPGLLLATSFLLFSCGASQQPAATEAQQAALTKDWDTWYKYTYHHIRLSQDFKPLNGDGKKMEKAAFLDSLMTGRYISLKKGDEGTAYQLAALKEDQADIRKTSIQMAGDARQLMAMEGKPLPPLRFTDLQGVTWNPAYTKGKVLLIKCWFISCVACVKEFPDLNRLVGKYRDRKDVLFLSLATDERKDLKEFLSNREFLYAVAPEAGAYMTGPLSVMSYPTHFLVDRQGIIRKVTNHIEDLIPSLERALQ